MMKIKVVHIINSFEYGGAEAMLCNLLSLRGPGAVRTGGRRLDRRPEGRRRGRGGGDPAAGDGDEAGGPRPSRGRPAGPVPASGAAAGRPDLDGPFQPHRGHGGPARRPGPRDLGGASHQPHPPAHQAHHPDDRRGVRPAVAAAPHPDRLLLRVGPGGVRAAGLRGGAADGHPQRLRHRCLPPRPRGPARRAPGARPRPGRHAHRARRAVRPVQGPRELPPAPPPLSRAVCRTSISSCAATGSIRGTRPWPR